MAVSTSSSVSPTDSRTGGLSNEAWLGARVELSARMRIELRALRFSMRMRPSGCSSTRTWSREM